VACLRLRGRKVGRVGTETVVDSSVVPKTSAVSLTSTLHSTNRTESGVCLRAGGSVGKEILSGNGGDGGVGWGGWGGLGLDQRLYHAMQGLCFENPTPIQVCVCWCVCVCVCVCEWYTN